MPTLPLSRTHPALAREWHPSKNRPLSPDTATAGMAHKVWWVCPENPAHVYQARIYVRTRAVGGTRCPHCSGRLVSPETSLRKRFPKIAAQWDTPRNKPLTPDDVTGTSTRIVSWKCNVGPDHRWKAKVHNRTIRKTGCPYCLNQRTAKDRSLAALFPALAKEWHPSLNGSLKPIDVTPGSSRLIWWRCPEGRDHEWLATPAARTTGNKTGCPACANLQLSVTNRLSTVHPEIARFWHPTKNGKLTPDKVVYSSTRWVWWRCPEAKDHVWRRRIYDQIHVGNTCPFCRNRRVSSSNCLAVTHPKVARYWDTERNGQLTPRDVTARSGRQVWWRCPKAPTHRWKSRVADRTDATTLTCPFCSGKRFSPENSLAARAPEVAAQWHPTRNSKLRPDQVHFGANRYVYWKCPEGPDHEWRAVIFKRGRDGHRCPFCTNKRLSVTNTLAAKFPEIAAEWDKAKNGKLRPDQMTFGSGVRVNWKCPRGEGHEWQSTVSQRTWSQMGCPFCSGRRIAEPRLLAKADPKLAALFHPTRNGKLTPYLVAIDSSRVVWWRCKRKPPHQWREQVAVQAETGAVCPECEGR